MHFQDGMDPGLQSQIGYVLARSRESAGFPFCMITVGVYKHTFYHALPTI